jgi:dTDP-4-dehydrorhamnose reductase
VKKVLVLGSTGMLGSAVADALQEKGHEVITASRSAGIKFDAVNLDTEKLLTAASLQKGDFVINCVGLTKSRIDESSMASRSLAVKLNIDFPNDLAKAAEKFGVKIIQVATDCVFSGLAGGYSEGSAHDPLDVYGKTKSLGEVPSENVMHLRCSLVGPEIGRSSLFFEWVRNQPREAKISGYTNHVWNGLSSRAFGKVVAGIVREDLFSAGVQHLVPADRVTKDALVRMELAALGRNDVSVQRLAADIAVDRTLRTENSKQNSELFLAAGYSEIPTIEQMVLEACENLPN